MAQNKKFSFIIPLYKDNYKTLDRCLLNIMEQDYKNYEIIFVHNSPDNESKNKLKNYTKELDKSKITYFEYDAGYDKKLGNGNHCHAFNVGANHATGDYLIFSDPDIYIYPGILREYKDAFEREKVDFVYGDYDFVNGGGRILGREYNEYELKCANYISGAFPITKGAFRGWDKKLESLQDWDMRLSAVDEGAKGYYIARPCFSCELSEKGGISSHSHENWEKVYSKVREKHNFPTSTTCVTSLGAPSHATNTAKILGVDTRVLGNILNFKPHSYKNIYLLGFYPLNWQGHLSLFYQLGKIKDGILAGEKRIIHWIGTDIFQMQHKLSWVTWKNMLTILNEKELGFVHLAECEQTQKELKELGIDADIVPLPPDKLFKPIPLPEKFTVGVYINPTQDMYYENFMYEIADAMPDIQFKFFGNINMTDKKEGNKEWVGWVKMEEFLPTISALIRLTVHDGLPLGPIQAMTAGRNCITSIKLPYTLHTEYIDGEPVKKDIISKIRELKKMPLNTEASDYWNKELGHDLFRERMKKYL